MLALVHGGEVKELVKMNTRSREGKRGSATPITKKKKMRWRRVEWSLKKLRRNRSGDEDNQKKTRQQHRPQKKKKKKDEVKEEEEEEEEGRLVDIVPLLAAACMARLFHTTYCQWRWWRRLTALPSMATKPRTLSTNHQAEVDQQYEVRPAVLHLLKPFYLLSQSCIVHAYLIFTTTSTGGT